MKAAKVQEALRISPHGPLSCEQVYAKARFEVPKNRRRFCLPPFSAAAGTAGWGRDGFVPKESRHVAVARGYVVQTTASGLFKAVFVDRYKTNCVRPPNVPFAQPNDHRL
jgi:hypothetical protein